MWKLCPHFPDTMAMVSKVRDAEVYVCDSHRLQSSPGYLQVGHVPSKWTWQIPQTSSSGISHLQVATPFHLLILTFIGVAEGKCPLRARRRY